MTIRDYTQYREEEILALYAAVGWTNYTQRPDMLRRSFENSLCTLAAFDGEDKLVGLVRAVGDGASALLIQDLLVLPDFQRRGVGGALLRTLLERFAEVYQIQLLTDDTEKTRSFYRALGFADAEELGCRAFLYRK